MSQPFALLLAFFALALPLAAAEPAAAPAPMGVPVAFELPTDGPLPRTYLVTLAIVEKKNPDWIVSQFACGVPCTVTAENRGRFSQTWNGLDDNFMPVPAGEYAVKGIYSPAKEWAVDGEWHAITPKFAGGASSFLPSPENVKDPMPFSGDPVNSPLADVAVGPNGIGVLYYQYLENGKNLPMLDLNKPIGYGQFLQAFTSGGAGGGTCVATDGESVWAYCVEGGPRYVYRADHKDFGKSPSASRGNSYLPPGWVTALAAWRDEKAGRSYVYIAQRGKMEEEQGDRGHRRYRESKEEMVNKLTVHAGADGKLLGEIPLVNSMALAVRGDTLYALRAEGEKFLVVSSRLAEGMPQPWQPVFTVPEKIHPADFEVDSHGRFYLSDSAANHVFQLDAQGKITRQYGRLEGQKPGTYDRESLMGPAKLATWKDAQGEDRLLIVENSGPNRLSEWSADGRLVREWMSLQTFSNNGYTFDPEHPEHAYIQGQRGWITRFRVDYATGVWTVDAVWPYENNDPLAGKLERPQFIRAGGRTYLAGRRSYTIYRFDGDKIVLSAGILRLRPDPKKPGTVALWHDANGNGRVDEEEITPTELPGRVLIYHGQRWEEDLSLLAPAQEGQDLWRLVPSSYDAHGNPVFTAWTKVLTDPIFVARRAGTADAIHGGNELSDKFTSDWMGADGTPETGYVVQARGGVNFSANEAPQHKISRYVPDGKGGYALKWRTGRTALRSVAKPGEMYGAMRIQRPMNGLIPVIDQSRCGVLLFNEEGLYVDTMFPDPRVKKETGIYLQGGEYFAGELVPNRQNGQIYVAFGKYTPTLYRTENWSLTENPVRKLAGLPASVTIQAAQIAAPSEMVLSLRGGAGAARFARFSPGVGEPAFDGSLVGWESCDPVTFQSGAEQNVEVRCLYQPDRLLLRWHARLGAPFAPRPLPPLERLFTHDQTADTVSLYLQTDPQARAAAGRAGRPGDARFVFGLYQDASGQVKPAAAGMYAEWSGPGARPQIYRTPVGEAKFAHVGAIAGAQLGHKLDDDGKGFVLIASIPRSALPRLRTPLAGGYRTMANFEATFAGHSKFWWSNADGSASSETYDEPTEASLYPGSWSPVEFVGLQDGIPVRNWLVAGPFGGPEAEQFKPSPGGLIPGSGKDIKTAIREFCESATYPLDSAPVDLKAAYSGPMIQGFWRDPKKVTWKPAGLAPLDVRVVGGDAGQIYYGATWIYSPTEVQLETEFHSQTQAELRWTVNGAPFPIKTKAYGDGRSRLDRMAVLPLPLRAGWNEVRFRGYCIGYSPFRAGLVLKGDEPKLWSLKLSGLPPGSPTSPK